MFERVKPDIYSRLVSERQELVRRDGSSSNTLPVSLCYMSARGRKILLCCRTHSCATNSFSSTRIPLEHRKIYI